jgi:FAD/FMN-containing dehydrogenase
MLFSRKEFIKITAFASVSAILIACGIEQRETDQKNKTLKKDPTPNPNPKIYKKKNSDNVLYISSENVEYDNLRKGFSKRINKLPAIIALCLNTKGVQEAVLFAKENNLKVAIKSGGHCFEGFSCNDGGLVINVSKLNQIELTKDNTLKAGAGCKLGELYDALLLENRIIPAGSCSGVGISGLTLGGGYGLFSREYGLTCDNLLELEIVTANGEIISSTEHPDLLWACKGGGNGNFGVVTQMTFKTYQAPVYLQSNRFKAFDLDATRAEIILKKWFEVAQQLPNHCFSAFVVNGKALTILITNFKAVDSDLTNLFNELTAVTDKTTLGGHTKLTYAVKVFYGAQDPIYFKNASVGLYNNFDDIAPICSTVLEKVIHGKGLIYQVNTLGGNISKPEFTENSSFPHRSSLFLSELQCYWEPESKSEDHINKFKEIQSLFSEAGINKQYVNYPAIENENFELAYYGDNLERLKQIKAKYDPDNLFCHAQSLKGS